MDIDGSTTVVTGGASGIGAGIVEMLLQHGGTVAVLDLPDSDGPAWAAGAGDRALFVPTDVTSPDDVSRAVAAVQERFGRIDVLVGAAGISPAARVVARDGTPFPLPLFRAGIEVNLIGAFDVLRQVASVMAGNEPNADGERGVVVSIASIAAFEGQVGQASYAAAKGGLVAMTLPLARDLAVHGIRVLTVCPGTIDTPMVRATSAEVQQSLARTNVFPHRLGTPADVAAVVRTCVEVPYLNGETIRVDAAVRLPPR